MPPPATPILRNVQPLFADFEFGGLAVGHNGNLTNALTLRRAAGAPRLPVPVHHRHRGVHPPDRHQPVCQRGQDRLIDALRQVEGAYSLVALTTKR